MKIARKTFIVVIIIVIGGLSGIVAERYFFPFLVSTKFFSKFEFLKKSMQDVTVVNRTEQVFVKEETSIDKIAGQVTPSVASIIIYRNIETKTNTAKKQLIKTDLTSIKSSAGVIITNDGLILTYFNIPKIDDYKFKAILSNGKTYDAELVGFDSYSNLAFLKVDESNLPTISFGNSDDSKPGEKLIAVGGNLENSGNIFASGLLGGLNPIFNLFEKPASSSEKLEGVFQSDFSNSKNLVGGPVIDYSGQVIGITGSVLRNNETEYFQIPSNKIKIVIEKHFRKELGQNATLGVLYTPITKIYALTNDLKIESGALISPYSFSSVPSVVLRSPADVAGIKIGDIITEVSGEKITAAKNLSDLIFQYKKGDKIKLKIIRDGKEMELDVNL